MDKAPSRSMWMTYINELFAKLMIPYFYTCFAVLSVDVFNTYFYYKDTSIEGVTRCIGQNLIKVFFAYGEIRIFPIAFFSIIVFQILLNIFNNKIGTDYEVRVSHIQRKQSSLQYMNQGKILSYIRENWTVFLGAHVFVSECLTVWITNAWVLLGIKIILALTCCWIITHVQENEKMTEKADSKREIVSRDASVDVVRGIFIISMLVGHFAIDNTLRNIIYSCHMIAFVFLSGYFYKRPVHIQKKVFQMCRTFLLPYIMTAVGIILVNWKSWSVEYFDAVFKQYLLGMSFSQKVFTNIASVGPIYFILLLLLVRLLYLGIDQWIENEIGKWMVVFAVSLIGVWLGNKGYWLPWSMDIVCYVLIFYQIGICAKKYHLLDFIKEHHIMYFLLLPVWGYMIYRGGMEIAIRNYGQYGLTITGAVSGVLITYKLAAYITEHRPIIAAFLEKCGQYSVIILSVHTMLGGIIGNVVAYRFNQYSAHYMLFVIFIQIMIALGFCTMKKFAVIKFS